jgi:transcriptional regulator with XRE-family HTH domain
MGLLRETRESQRVSQAALAAKLGLPQTFVSKCETGVRRLDVVELHAWLSALNVNFSTFLKLLERRWSAHAARIRIL